MRLELRWREEDGARLASSVWRAGPGLRTISSAMLGGGIGAASWVLNAQVAGAYARTDPVAHLRELAASHGLDGPGVGMLTAASVARTARGSDEGVAVSATVGLRVPTWASSPPGRPIPNWSRSRWTGRPRRASTGRGRSTSWSRCRCRWRTPPWSTPS